MVFQRQVIEVRINLQTKNNTFKINLCSSTAYCIRQSLEDFALEENCASNFTRNNPSSLECVCNGSGFYYFITKEEEQSLIPTVSHYYQQYKKCLKTVLALHLFVIKYFEFQMSISNSLPSIKPPSLNSSTFHSDWKEDLFVFYTSVLCVLLIMLTLLLAICWNQPQDFLKIMSAVVLIVVLICFGSASIVDWIKVR